MATVTAAAGAATAAVGGQWLFSYNRQNFQFDAPMRFGRFTAARGFANAQTGQYREDTHGIPGVTVTKMNATVTICTVFFVMCAQTTLAGRIGMHGPAPPMWFCSLLNGHQFSAALYAGVGLWLAMHANMRAQTSMTSLLTRKVRLPIPSIAQLDSARQFGSAFEKQSLRDVFRVPFMRHSQAAPEAPPGSEDEEEKETKKGKKGKKEKGSKFSAPDPATKFASTNRDTVPSWIRDEQVVDKGIGKASSSEDTTGFAYDPHDTPEHFKMIAKAQEDWWMFDVYARIMLLFAACNFLHAACYWLMGSAMCELRAFWIVWSSPMMFMTAQALILRLDIVQGSAGQHRLPGVEFLGHIAPYVTAAAMTIEYKNFYSPTAEYIGWILVYVAYLFHFLMALRFLDLAYPDSGRAVDMPDEAGKSWWPKHWTVPAAFAKALWVLAPPKKLEPGQHDLLHEMTALASTGGGVSLRKRRGDKPKDKDGKEAKKAQNLSVIAGKAAKIERLFQFWFEEGVWPQVPERGQRKLHEIYAKFGVAKQQVGQVLEDYAPDDEDEGPEVAALQHEGHQYYLDKASGNTSWEIGADDARRVTSIQDVEKRVAELASLMGQIGDNFDDFDALNTLTEEKDSFNDNLGYTVNIPFMGLTHSQPDLPWRIVAVSIGTVAFVWVYMMIVLGVEIAIGDGKIMKFPGEPPWIRDTKLRNWLPDHDIHDSTKNSLPSDYELYVSSVARYTEDAPYGVPLPGHKTPAELAPPLPTAIPINASAVTTPAPGSAPAADGHSSASAAGHGSHHRRMLTASAVSLEGLVNSLPSLAWLAETIEKSEEIMKQALVAPPVAASFMAPTDAISWPALFEPRHLICPPAGVHEGLVGTLTNNGFGALARVGAGHVPAEPFALDGLEDFGALAGASWDAAGLHVVTRPGHLLLCPGGPAGDAWACNAQGRLPVPKGASLLAAAVSPRLVAMQLDTRPDVIALYTAEGHPAGEVHVQFQGRVGLSFNGDELLVAAVSGEVLRRNVLDGSSSLTPTPWAVAGRSVREFQGACGRSEGLLRLALKTAGGAGAAWGPELVL